MTGTTRWKAPETFHGRARRASDVFSFGMLICEVITRKVPFAGEPDTVVLEKLSRRFRYDEHLEATTGATEAQQRTSFLASNPLVGRRPTIPARVRKTIPNALIDLMQRCWCDAPIDRPTFIEIRGTLEAIESAASAEVAETTRADVGITSARDHTMDTIVARLNAMELRLSERFNEQHGLLMKVQQQQEEVDDALDSLCTQVAGVTDRLDGLEHLILQTAARQRQFLRHDTPPLFVCWPDITASEGKRWCKPSLWFSQQLRIHLLCCGNPERGTTPHFLFKTLAELRGEKCGYRLLHPKPELKKWGTAIKVGVAAALIAVKVGISALGAGDLLSSQTLKAMIDVGSDLTFERSIISHAAAGAGGRSRVRSTMLQDVPELAAAQSGYALLFSESGTSDLSDDVLQERMEAVLAASFEELSHESLGGKKKAKLPPGLASDFDSAKVKAAAKAMSLWIHEQERVFKHRFFGLELDPASLRPGVVDGPAWRCPACMSAVEL